MKGEERKRERGVLRAFLLQSYNEVTLSLYFSPLHYKHALVTSLVMSIVYVCECIEMRKGEGPFKEKP